MSPARGLDCVSRNSKLAVARIQIRRHRRDPGSCAIELFLRGGGRRARVWKSESSKAKGEALFSLT